MTLISLFFQFVKFGSLAIGGGFTILPLLFDLFVNQTKLFSADSFGNLISIAQMTPGPVTINIATFAGFLIGGPIASIVASLGLIFPSLIVTGTALFFIKRYQNSWVVQGFLKGARWVAFVMVVYAFFLFLNMSVLSDVWSIWDIWKSLIQWQFIGPKNYHVNYPELSVAILSFILIRRKVPATRLMIGAAFFGYIISFL